MLGNISLKWKVLSLAVAGPLVIALVLTVQQVIQIRQSGQEDILNQSKAVLLMAEAARDEMAKKTDIGSNQTL